MPASRSPPSRLWHASKGSGLAACAPIVPPETGTTSYFRTAIEFVAPAGKWQWLNEAIFLCTAGLVQDKRNTVQVDVFKLV